MSQSVLIRTNGPMPPGGYQFTDPITGKVYRDRDTLFEGRVKQVVRDRQANARLITNPKFTDPANVAGEISAQNCQRLRNDPKYCTGGAVAQAVRLSAAARPVYVEGQPCPFCKATTIKKAVCLTCGGKIMFTCLACRRGWR